jgi:AcrR family transcriptional regulator
MGKHNKGKQTKENILRHGLELASTIGLVNLSIGSLAQATNMSRSGLFAHFLSKEKLQLDILSYAEKLFVQSVLIHCEQAQKPLQKLINLTKYWPGWFERLEPKINGGCIFLMATMEFDDRPGPVKDFLLEQQRRLVKYIGKMFREAQDEGHFQSDFPKEQFAFEFYASYMGYHQYSKFFDDDNAKGHLMKSLQALFERAGCRPMALGDSTSL